MLVVIVFTAAAAVAVIMLLFNYQIKGLYSSLANQSDKKNKNEL